jgi:2-polyprenyl-3-methyl-5-hydroxy-6-metoxy-1,4-benzoquinol methylase
MPDEKDVKSVYMSGYTKRVVQGLNSHLHYMDSYFEQFCRIQDLNFHDIGYQLDSSNIRVLDVGCANGLFLRYLLRYPNVSAKGIDISPEMVSEAQARGLCAEVGEIDSVDETFDLVTYWDVIEHLFWPAQALRKTHSILNVGGGLIIQTPCRGVIAEAYGSSWCHYVPPQHVHIFNQNSLFYLLVACGFHIVKSVRYGSGTQRGTLPDRYKAAFDTVAKRPGIGDTIVVYGMKSRQ